MRSKVDVFVLILSVTSFLFLCPLSYATKSRLMGMGDLSIVIEDESNMINLWDFAHNPAGFLADEKGSVIRSDFLWDAYHIEDLPYCNWRYNNLYSPVSRIKANGDMFDNWVSLSFRKQGVFAFGLAGDYILRQTDSEYDKHEFNYPNFHLVFSKSLNSLTSIGASLSFMDSDFEFTRTDNVFGYKTDFTKEEVVGVRAEAGFSRELLSGPIIGGVVGFHGVHVDYSYLDYRYYSEPQYNHYVYPTWLPGFNAVWLSGQAVIGMERRIKVGLEGKVQFLNYKDRYKEDDTRFCLRVRGFYDPSSKLRLGIFFANGESSTEFCDPVYSYFSSIRHDTPITEWGTGLALRPQERVLMGIEYHFSNYPQPLIQALYPWSLETRSVNLGIEGKLSEALFLRGGYVNATIKRKPNPEDRIDSKENVITVGLGFQSFKPDLIFELSYCHVFKKYREWYWGWDLESGTRVLSFSFRWGL